MLLVKTRIGPSKVAGTGLFADEFISKGTPVWRLEPGFDVKLTQAQFDALPEVAQKAVLNYCYVEPNDGTYIMCMDDARFFNHSDVPNVSSGPGDDHIDRALRDIEPGEEMTQDYRNFDENTEQKLGSGPESQNMAK
jgi:hypothetical protein